MRNLAGCTLLFWQSGATGSGAGRERAGIFAGSWAAGCNVIQRARYSARGSVVFMEQLSTDSVSSTSCHATHRGREIDKVPRPQQRRHGQAQADYQSAAG